MVSLKGELMRSMNEMCMSYEEPFRKLHVVAMESAQCLVNVLRCEKIQ